MKKTKPQLSEASRSIFHHVSKNVFFLIHRDPYLEKVQKTSYGRMEMKMENLVV